MERLERPRLRCAVFSRIHSAGLRLAHILGYSGFLVGPMRADDPKVPSIPVRLSLVKLFLELSLFNPALITLQGIMASDDQEVEAWYLEGWGFYLMAELAHDSPNGKLEGEGLTWEELAKDSRDCLEMCKNVGVQTTHFSWMHPDQDDTVTCCSGTWGRADTRACERTNRQPRSEGGTTNA